LVVVTCVVDRGSLRLSVRAAGRGFFCNLME